MLRTWRRAWEIKGGSEGLEKCAIWIERSCSKYEGKQLKYLCTLKTICFNSEFFSSHFNILLTIKYCICYFYSQTIYVLLIIIFYSTGQYRKLFRCSPRRWVVQHKFYFATICILNFKVVIYLRIAYMF